MRQPPRRRPRPAAAVHLQGQKTSHKPHQTVVHLTQKQAPNPTKPSCTKKTTPPNHHALYQKQAPIPIKPSCTLTKKSPQPHQTVMHPTKDKPQTSPNHHAPYPKTRAEGTMLQMRQRAPSVSVAACPSRPSAWLHLALCGVLAGPSAARCLGKPAAPGFQASHVPSQLCPLSLFLSQVALSRSAL